MRSNFREIPLYLDLLCEYGFEEVALQTAEINAHNSSREPKLAEDEALADAGEIAELYTLMQGSLPAARRRFRSIRISGLTSLFEVHGLDAGFLQEGSRGLYPNSGDLAQDDAAGTPLCPNPWTTMFVAENGDVHLCFLAEPVGNLYEAPLAEIWNSPRALAKRSHMISGRYLASGCSARWCSWREGKPATPPDGIAGLRTEMRQLAERAAAMEPLVRIGEAHTDDSQGIAQVRRVAAGRDRRIRELEALFVDLCATNAAIHEKGQRKIDELEAGQEKARRRIEHLEASQQKALADFADLHREYSRLRGMLPVRIADKVSRLWRRRPAGGAP